LLCYFRNSPSDTLGFRDDHILSFYVLYDGSSDTHIKLPNEQNIKRLMIDLTVICFSQHSTSNIPQPPTIPNGIKYLEIKVYKTDDDTLVNFIRSIEIPNSVEILEIISITHDKLNSITTWEIETITSLFEKLFNKQQQKYDIVKEEEEKENVNDVVVVRKSRKLDNVGGKENLTSTTKEFNIPSSVKTLSLETVNSDILRNIPVTVTSLIVNRLEYNQFLYNNIYYNVFDVDLPPTINYISIVYREHDESNKESLRLFKRARLENKQLQQQYNNIFESYERPLSCYIKYLYFQPSNEIPNDLVYLELARLSQLPSFNRISSLVTSTLKYLSLPFNQYLAYKGYIPRSVRYLNIVQFFEIECYTLHQILVPSSVKYIGIDPNLKNIIQTIDVEEYYYQPKEYNINNNNNQLKTLILPNDIQIHVPPYSLPYGIEELSISNNLITSSNIVPPTVKRLKICMEQGEQINIESFPPKLDYLEVNITHSNSSPQYTSNNQLFTNPTYSSKSTFKTSDISYIITINSLKVQLKQLKENNGDQFINVDKCVIIHQQ